MAKKKKKKTIEATSTLSPAEDGATLRPEKVDSTKTNAHKKRVKKLAKDLIRQVFQVPPGAMLAEKEAGLGGKALQRVSTFVRELTNFATSYNKLASVLIQGQ